MFYEIAKRVLDLTIAIIASIILFPILLTVAIAIKLDGTEGPIFSDTGVRLGRGRKPFFMYKFRSMIVGAHVDFWKNHPEYNELYKEWKETGKLPIKVDPRVTNVGRIIRKTDLDELAQLINVLKGDMSIVGPRPPFPDELNSQIKEFPGIKPNVVKAYTVRPGITGIWQVSGRNSIPTPDRFEMEAEYAMRRNLLDDVKIILQTPHAVITRKGAAE